MQTTTMQELVIASRNAGKIREIRNLLPHIPLLSTDDIGFTEEIPEPFDSFEENAHAKAWTIHRFSGKNVLADDSGLCVYALDGAPGVHSAYYAGQPGKDENNLHKLVSQMEGVADRRAYYKAVICLVWNGEVHYFEGTCEGHIAEEKKGNEGFGYDPVFIPLGYTESFGQLPLDIKNKMSHRARALEKMVAFLNQNQF